MTLLASDQDLPYIESQLVYSEAKTTNTYTCNKILIDRCLYMEDKSITVGLLLM